MYDTPETIAKRKVALRYWLQGKGYHVALEAMEFAAQHHTGTRKDGVTPEFDHQVSICHFIRTLPDLMHEEETIATMLLHDVPEDYDVSIKTIEEMFGAQIAEATELLNKNDAQGRPKNHLSMIEALARNPIASVGKPADRIHNWNSMNNRKADSSEPVFTPEKQARYVVEGEALIPMVKAARRLFPRQERAYENLKHMLLSQSRLLRAMHADHFESVIGQPAIMKNEED
jgi:(p)ppGpp synthase/HD superfamily hydrolase